MAILWLRYPWLYDGTASFHFFFLMPLFALAIPLIVIDCQWLLLPNRIVYPLAAFGLVGNLAAFFVPGMFRPFSLWSGFAGAITGFLIFQTIAWGVRWMIRKDGMGGGDIKLIGALGLFLGFQNTLLTIFLSSVIGILMALWMAATGRMEKGKYIPFGPAILSGAIIASLWGNTWVTWYLRWVTGQLG